jgi:hypothetical protein
MVHHSCDHEKANPARVVSWFELFSAHPMCSVSVRRLIGQVDQAVEDGEIGQKFEIRTPPQPGPSVWSRRRHYIAKRLAVGSFFLH